MKRVKVINRVFFSIGAVLAVLYAIGNKHIIATVFLPAILNVLQFV